VALGVYVACQDLGATEALSNALDAAEDLFLAPTADRADVVIATPSDLEGVPPGPAVVVLALREDPLPAAREAIARGAQGILGWPADEALLSLSLHEAAARRSRDTTARGRIVSVVGARGGAGATTVAAYLARAMGDSTLLLDLGGGVAGQAIYAPSEPHSTLVDLEPLLGEITVDAVTRSSHEHASGVPCLYGGPSPARDVGRLASAVRDAAGITIVDGAISPADLTLVVVGPDVGSIRAAAALDPNASVVLNRSARGRIRARNIERALGRQPVVIVPDDPRIGRAADLGRLTSHGESVRRFRRLAKRIRSLLDV
jgi:Flp pilus assembly CpaE family ATPase